MKYKGSMRTCLYCSASEEDKPFVTGKNQCKDCYNTWFREYYKKNADKRQQNRDLVRENRPNRRQRNRELVDSLKRGKPCTDCGHTFHPYVMDFDHLDGSQKEDGIARMLVNCRSKQAILDEIAKCELVCSNCHRIRTLIRRIGKIEYEKFIADE